MLSWVEHEKSFITSGLYLNLLMLLGFFFYYKWLPCILRCQTQQLSSALSSAGYFKSHCCKQYEPRSDCCLIWVHTVCLNAKSMFEKFARRCSRRHKLMTFSDVVFLGILRVKCQLYKGQLENIQTFMFLSFHVQLPTLLIHTQKLSFIAYKCVYTKGLSI